MREVMPGDLKGAALENFIRDSVVTYWHQTCLESFRAAAGQSGRRQSQAE